MAFDSSELQAVNGAGAAAVPGRPEQVWMPVKHAARAAGVPERSAFRWAKKGVVPVRWSGKVQLVEVAALTAYAARPMNSRAAEAGAAVAPGAGVPLIGRGSQLFSGGAGGNAAIAAAEAEELEERFCMLEVGWEDLILRLEALEGGV